MIGGVELLAVCSALSCCIKNHHIGASKQSVAVGIELAGPGGAKVTTFQVNKLSCRPVLQTEVLLGPRRDSHHTVGVCSASCTNSE